MPAIPISFWVDAVIVLLSVVVLMFILKRLGVIVWIWWASRSQRPRQDSAARKYWSTHE